MTKVRAKTSNEKQSAVGQDFRAPTNVPGFRRPSLIIIICCLLLNVFPVTLSLKAESVEYAVKFAVLYNFVKFVDWPAASYSDPDAPLEICVVGHDPFSRDIEGGLRTRKVGGHPIQVLTLKPSDALGICHMVFIPVTEKDQARAILQSVKGLNILTVGETDGFAAMGGVINLTVEDRGVHFEINRVAAERAHLKLSAQLLGLAKIVTDHDSGRKN